MAMTKERLEAIIRGANKMARRETNDDHAEIVGPVAAVLVEQALKDEKGNLIQEALLSER